MITLSGPPGDLDAAIRPRFATLGAVELSRPPRDAIREPPSSTNDRD
jgi:hypothetical protein